MFFSIFEQKCKTRTTERVAKVVKITSINNINYQNCQNFSSKGIGSSQYGKKMLAKMPLESQLLFLSYINYLKLLDNPSVFEIVGNPKNGEFLIKATNELLPKRCKGFSTFYINEKLKNKHAMVALRACNRAHRRLIQNWLALELKGLSPNSYSQAIG